LNSVVNLMHTISHTVESRQQKKVGKANFRYK
jgi:hypothetical protein